MRIPRLTAASLALALTLAAGLLAGRTEARPPRAEGRVVVLGIDGASHATVARLIEEGRLPNLARLAQQGTFSPLGTTHNAESAVAWAALNTGQNPSKTGIPGFIKRELVDGMPQPAPAFQRIETRAVADLEAGLVIGTLSGRNRTVVAAGAAVIALLGFAFVFRVLLRLGWLLTLLLSAGLAGLGGYAAWKARGYVPASVPGVVANPLEVRTFWEVAAEAGVESVVIDAAMSWDRPTMPGARVLAGLGVPDSRGGTGDWFIYTTDELEFEAPPKGRERVPAGTIFKVSWREEAIETEIFGPYDFVAQERIAEELAAVGAQLEDNTRGWKEGETLRDEEKRLQSEASRLGKERMTVPLRVERAGEGRVRVTIGDSSQLLDDQAWSDWYRFSFEMNPLVKVHAITRVRVLSMEPFSLYVNTLDIDPANPPFWQPISQPSSFSAELASATGDLFETYGWACATMPFKSGDIAPEVLIEDLEFTMKWRERLTHEALGRDDWQLLMSVFSTPDRMQHMMYQYYDPEHPLYDAEVAQRKISYFGEEISLAETIPAVYRQIDRIVGDVLARLRPEDVLIICADHGFQSFRHQFHVNNWLEQNGYLVMRDDVQMRERKMLQFVDWSRTRAYALGFGTVYLNLAGREREGIVKPEEADALMREIADRLAVAADDRPGHVGQRAIDQVVVFKDIHSGPYLDREGDLIIGFAPTYRVSWATTLGDIDLKKDDAGKVVTAPVFEPNDSPWSGEHVSVAPSNVAGILFSNLKLALPEGGPDLLHIAPTVLGLLDVEIPADLDLAPLSAR